MRITFRQPAPEHTVWPQDAFAGQIGERIPLRIDDFAQGDDGVHLTATLVDARVLNDGTSVELVLDIANLLLS